jgi:hypothetical protein
MPVGGGGQLTLHAPTRDNLASVVAIAAFEPSQSLQCAGVIPRPETVVVV